MLGKLNSIAEAILVFYKFLLGLLTSTCYLETVASPELPGKTTEAAALAGICQEFPGCGVSDPNLVMAQIKA